MYFVKTYSKDLIIYCIYTFKWIILHFSDTIYVVRIPLSHTTIFHNGEKYDQRTGFASNK